MPNLLSAPNWGAPGRRDRTEGRAKRAVKHTAKSCGPSITWNRLIMTPSQVMRKIKIVESQLTDTATIDANLTRPVLLALTLTVYGVSAYGSAKCMGYTFVLCDVLVRMEQWLSIQLFH
jgi:hypothetical protein